MPELPESIGLPVALALGMLLVVWYFAGNELMRRRARRLALWSKRVLDPFGGKQSIRWLGGQAFRMEVEGTKAPFRSVMLSGLIESWDVPMVWAWNRLNGRRDMVMLQATLQAPPVWGFEVYRPGTLLAGDSRHLARQEGWTEEAFDELRIAAPGDRPRLVAGELVHLLNAERSRLVRLAVRRQGPQLTLALNVPDPREFEPADLSRILRRLADRLDEH